MTDTIRIFGVPMVWAAPRRGHGPSAVRCAGLNDRLRAWATP
jgi:arginase family enzyme